MKNQSRLPLLLVLFITSVLSIDSNVIAQSNGGAGAPQPPMAEKKTKTTNIHGETIVDEYFWLREKTNPSVQAYLKSEDDYAQAAMKHTVGLQALGADLEEARQVAMADGLDHLDRRDAIVRAV